MTIPKRARKPLLALLHLSANDRAELRNAIRSAEPALSSDVFSARIAGAMPGMTRPQLDEILQVLYSLYNMVTTERADVAVAHDVATALRTVDDTSATKTLDADFVAFEELLLDLLRCHDSLGMGAKAISVMHQHDRILVRSQVFSDIRPIFRGTSDETTPSGAVIVHTLKLHTHTSGDYVDLYMALDRADLEELKRVVDRALGKHEALATVLSNAGVVLVDVEGSD